MSELGATSNTASYRYRALDASGGMHAGELSSMSRASALNTLKQRGLLPVEVDEEASPVSLRRWPWQAWALQLEQHRKEPSRRELVTITQSLAALLTAGLMVDRALQISVLLASGPAPRKLAEALLKAVRSGKTLSASFAAASQNLPPYYTSMIEAGETGGTLADALTRLAELLRRQLEIRERVRSALIYPALLAGVVLVTLILLLAFVLPRFDAMFAESDAPLPWSTAAVLSVGRFVSQYWWALLAVTACAALAFWRWSRSSAGRQAFDRWLVRSRLTLALPASLDMARMLRTLSTLCRSGSPLPSALRIARGTLTNHFLINAFAAVIRDVQAGRSLSQSMAPIPEVPTVVVQLARVGEETGRLEALLRSAADLLEEESHNKLERLLTLLVPLVTIGMGVIVAVLIGSVLVGLLSINDLAF